MDADDFITLSARRRFPPFRRVAPEEVLKQFLAALTSGLREGGCAMLGHVKGMVECEGAPTLFFSLTSLDSDPRYSGGPLRPGSTSTLSMNVIVAGISRSDAARILEGLMARHLA